MTRNTPTVVLAKMHMTTQVSTAVSPSALGAFAVTELKMLTSTRNSVTSRAIRPARDGRMLSALTDKA